MSLYNAISKKSELGQWIPYPSQLFRLLQQKKLNTNEYLVLSYMIQTCVRLDADQLNFSRFHLRDNLNMSDSSAMRAIKTLISSGFILKSNSSKRYGNQYRVLTGAIKRELDMYHRDTTNNQLNYLRDTYNESQRHIPCVTETKTTCHRDSQHYKNIYIYLSKASTALSEDKKIQFSNDGHRLITENIFTDQNIKTYIEQNKNNLHFHNSLYAVMKKKTSSKALDELETQMTIARRNRENERAKNEAQIEAIKNQSNPVEFVPRAKNINKNEAPSFKVSL